MIRIDTLYDTRDVREQITTTNPLAYNQAARIK